jgi:hypothetical protein
MAAVAHCTAVATSLPLDSAWKAPCAAAWHAPAGAPPRLAQANHSAYERSSGVGTTFFGSTFRLCSTTSQDDRLAVPVGFCAPGDEPGCEGADAGTAKGGAVGGCEAAACADGGGCWGGAAGGAAGDAGAGCWAGWGGWDITRCSVAT